MLTKGYKEKVKIMCKRLGMMIPLLLTVLLVTGCSVPKLPDRQALAPNVLPEPSQEKARVYFYLGYRKSGSYEGRMEYNFGHVYVNNKEVSYISIKETVAIDVSPGTHEIYWKMHAFHERDKDFHAPVPYALTVKAGDVVYLEANELWVENSSASLLTAVGGVVGGAIAGSTVHGEDYLEKEPTEGPKFLKEMTIVEYYDLSSSTAQNVETPKISSGSEISRAATEPQDMEVKSAQVETYSRGDQVEEKLTRLKKMYEQGIITEEEYKKEKAEALETY